jgi:hypothetical protein
MEPTNNNQAHFPATARGIQTTTGFCLATNLPQEVSTNIGALPNTFRSVLTQDSPQAPRRERANQLDANFPSAGGGAAAASPTDAMPNAIHSPAERESRVAQVYVTIHFSDFSSSDSFRGLSSDSFNNQPSNREEASTNSLNPPPTPRPAYPARQPATHPNRTIPTEIERRSIAEMQKAIRLLSIEGFRNNFAPTSEDSQSVVAAFKQEGLREIQWIRENQRECQEAVTSIRERLQALFDESRSGCCCFAPPPPEPFPDKFYKIVQAYSGDTLPHLSKHRSYLEFLNLLSSTYKDELIQTEIYKVERLVSLIFARVQDLSILAENCCRSWDGLE